MLQINKSSKCMKNIATKYKKSNNPIVKIVIIKEFDVIVTQCNNTNDKYIV